MTAPARRDQVLASLPPLAAVRPQVITKDRQIVDTTGDVWRFRASDDGGRLLHISWPVIAGASAPIPLSERVMQTVKLYIAHRLTFSKGMTIWNDSVMFRRFFRWYATHAQRASRPVAFEWRAADQGIRILRRPDGPHDSRPESPR